jgi:hypothetical protein
MFWFMLAVLLGTAIFFCMFSHEVSSLDLFKGFVLKASSNIVCSKSKKSLPVITGKLFTIYITSAL